MPDATSLPRLTFEGLRARPVIVPMNRPIVNRVITVERWPVILIDLHTREGVVGRSYLQPYLARTMPWIIAILEDLAEQLQGQPLNPSDIGVTTTTRTGGSLIRLQHMDQPRLEDPKVRFHTAHTPIQSNATFPQAN